MRKRLLKIADDLTELIENGTRRPWLSRSFFSRNTTTAIGAAQGRGVAVLSGARAGLPVYEYTPVQVKLAVSGYGRADKHQVQQMVRVLLVLPRVPKPMTLPMRWRSPFATRIPAIEPKRWLEEDISNVCLYSRPGDCPPSRLHCR